MGRKPKDLTGMRFGYLVVLGPATPFHQPSKNGKYTKLCWKVRCDCGTVKTVSACSLRQGIKCCGCLSGKRGAQKAGRKRYSVWDNKTDELIVLDETAPVCAELMGLIDSGSFWEARNRSNKGIGPWRILDSDDTEIEEEQLNE